MRRKNVKRMHRPCERCDKRFLPHGRFSRVCLDCVMKAHLLRLANNEEKHKERIKEIPI